MAEKPVAVYGALAANLGIAIAKFVAASISGSSAILAEAIHSSVDTMNQVFMLVGLHRGRRPPSAQHPFGHGKELYFWSLLVAILLFGIGGGMSFYEGLRRFNQPHGNPSWGASYVVLAISFAFEGASWFIATRAIRRDAPARRLLPAVRASKDPSKFIVFGEDSAALLGLVVATTGVVLSQVTGSHRPDAVASMIIGLILGGVAVFLASESKALLIGESADGGMVRRIQAIVRSKPYVTESRPPLTMHLGPHEILLNLDVLFDARLSAPDLACAVEDLEQSIRSALPDVKRIYIEASLLRERPMRPARTG